MKYRFNEDATLEKALEYIKSTYGKHYADDEQGRQLMDEIVEDGEQGFGFLKWSAQKYLRRFGKKGGKNLADLYKGIHYLTLMLYMERGNGTFAEDGDKVNKDQQRKIVEDAMISAVEAQARAMMRVHEVKSPEMVMSEISLEKLVEMAKAKQIGPDAGIKEVIEPKNDLEQTVRELKEKLDALQTRVSYLEVEVQMSKMIPHVPRQVPTPVSPTVTPMWPGTNPVWCSTTTFGSTPADDKTYTLSNTKAN